MPIFLLVLYLTHPLQFMKFCSEHGCFIKNPFYDSEWFRYSSLIDTPQFTWFRLFKVIQITTVTRPSTEIFLEKIIDRAKNLGLIFWIITRHVLSVVNHPFYLMINLIKLWIAQKIVYVFLITTWIPITYQCLIKAFITLTEFEVNLLVLFSFYNLLPINKFRNHKFCCVAKILLHKAVNS